MHRFESSTCRVHSLGNHGIIMHRRDKAGLERRRRQIHTGIEHRVEELIEALFVAGHHFRIIARHVLGEINTEHATDGVATESDTRLSRRLGQTIHQLRCLG